ncbi:cyclin-domain-containing protein [Xylariomycetidae sp. FL0641]|nr:cyclin-domain-containing protein [Xylariomycetidae sp. FL0641]
MEPFDPTVLLQGAQRLGSQAANTTTAILADPRPSSTVPEPPPEPSVTPESHKLNKQGAAPFSPNKRRNPHDHTHAQSSNPVVVPSQPISPKRSKPNATPPKVLPLQYELCAVEDIVVLIANMVGELIETNDKLAIKSGNLTRFHSRTAPGISVLDYLQRLAKHATLTPPLLLSMVFYIDRLCAMYPDFTINSLTVHRFLITAATVAGKGLSDSFWNNSFYARVGGIKVAELKLLELDFLCRVDWKIVPIPEVLVYNYRCLVERCAGYTLPDEPEISMQDDDSDEIGDDEFDA